MTLTNQSNEKKIVIKCPHCGWEYVPAEIFMPTDLEGKPENIVKDALGKILYVDYEKDYNPEQTAKYICDGCGKPFLVESTVVYKAKKEAEELDFSDTSVSLI